MKKRFGCMFMALILVLMMAFTGCTAAPASEEGGGAEGGESQPAVAEGGENYHFVIILKDLTRPFMISMGDEAQKAAEMLGITLDVLGPQTANSTEEQIKLMEDAIATGVDGILITPADSTAIVPGIEKANEAGIPVTTPNTKAFGGEVLTWAGVENYDVGYRLGEELARVLNYEGKVVLLEGIPGSSTSTERIEGYNDALAQYPDIEIIASQTAYFSRLEGMSVMENLLQRFPEIDGIGSADKEMLLGANEAIKEAGREGIAGVGFDVDEDVLVAIENGEVAATGDQHAESQAFWSVVALWAYLEGYTVPGEMVIPMEIVNQDNVAEYLEQYQ